MPPRQQLAGAAVLSTMTQSPDIRRNGRYLVGSELSPAHRGHRRAILFRLRDTTGDCPGDSGEAAIAPKPLGVREIRTQRCAGTIRAMATRAGRSADLAVIDTIAQRNHFPRCPLRNGEIRHVGSCSRIWMGAFRGFGVSYTDFPSRRGGTWTWCDFRGATRVACAATVDNAIDPSANVV